MLVEFDAPEVYSVCEPVAQGVHRARFGNLLLNLPNLLKGGNEGGQEVGK